MDIPTIDSWVFMKNISVQLTGEKTGKIFEHQQRVYEGELKFRTW